MTPGDLIKFVRPSFSSNTVCLWSGPEDSARVVDRIPLGVVTVVIAVLMDRTITSPDTTQLLVISPKCRLGYVSSLCAEQVDV